MVPLSTTEVGQRVKLRSVHGGRRIVSRLSEMGLVSGAELQIVGKTRNGPMLVQVGRTRLALGRGVTRKIRVTLSES